ncbi:MAG: hypothetical protein CVV03_00635 [Firmicutes bacterium HGW-Firmicutes-8]|nr:MAG: hypothetical protein CVV03_00635 [Firmicutes bacterium HGW-Firmicutes-8]
MQTQGNKQTKFDAIVCLSQIDWDFLWQRTQEIMSQFAAMGYPVLFVENTGVRIPGIKDAPRIWNRLKKVFSPVKGSPTESNSNIEILSPFALPFPYLQTAVKLNAALLRSKILQFSKQRNIPLNRILLWSYMTTPLAVELANSLPWAGVVVDLVSDPCKVSGAEEITVSHKKMLQSADVILCASVPVMNTTKQYLEEGRHLKVHLFEDGFSTRLIDLAKLEFKELNLHVRDAAKPLVAYIGGVNSKIWWDAVSAMAQAFPEVNFVFVGPKEYDELPCAGFGKNVAWLPPFKEYSQLGYFLKRCRAGLIPYTPTPYVAEMRPAKINEYMVMGLPIVATKMPELQRFSDENGPGIAYLADDADSFVAVLKQALTEDCKEYQNKRKRITQNRSWETVCRELEDNLQQSI